jgi:hypothetical protein
MTWWDQFVAFADKSPVLAGTIGTVVGGLILALILWVISRIPKLRKPVFGGISRLGRFLRSVRVTTTNRIEREYERGVDEGWAGHEREVEEETKLGREISIFTTPREDLKREAPAPRPAPKPRWRVYESEPEGDGFDFIVANSVERSVAQEVRLEASASYFEFYDGAHWEDASGVCYRSFRGKISSWARDRGGVDFDITWLDENGESHSHTYKLYAHHPPDSEEDEYPF